MLSKASNGSSGGMGSISVTSIAAAKIWCDLSASDRATWSTTGPREVLTKIAVGFIAANSATPIRW